MPSGHTVLPLFHISDISLRRTKKAAQRKCLASGLENDLERRLFLVWILLFLGRRRHDIVKSIPKGSWEVFFQVITSISDREDATIPEIAIEVHIVDALQFFDCDGLVRHGFFSVNTENGIVLLLIAVNQVNRYATVVSCS